MSSVALKDYKTATFNGFTKRLRPKDNRVEPLFAAYYFRSSFFRAHVNSMTTLTTRASPNNDMLAKLPFLLPPIEIQKRVGVLLSTIDDKIITNQRINRNLEKQILAMYEQSVLLPNLNKTNG
ncbi:MAG: restriction endonuclease subunit S, partial [Thermoguttaceae bacterium]|nr:restriction endonuclease subunit S [Thermoguttaceae bacterium]